MPLAQQVLYLETRQQKGTHLLFLPVQQNFLCSGPGQCGGGSVKEDEGGERKGEGARDGAEAGGRGRGPVGQGQGPDRSSQGATAPQPKVTRGDRPNPRGPVPSGQTTEGIVLDTHDIMDHLLAKE